MKKEVFIKQFKIGRSIELFFVNKQNEKLIFNGDSLAVAKYLLNNGFSGKFRLLYIDPPYGLNADLKNKTNYHEAVEAFNDKWKNEKVYKAFLKSRFLSFKKLLAKNGSCFVQSSHQNLHLILDLMNEVYGKSNFITIITFRKRKLPKDGKILGGISDFLLWYVKDFKKATAYIKNISTTYADQKIENIWNDTSDPIKKVYPVQTDEKIIKRCLLIATKSGDMVFDPMSGSGTAAICAEEMQRKWIISDSSKIATSIAVSRIGKLLKSKK
jgi:DNA modification methylase